MNDTEDKHKQYLLGNLPVDETEQIDLQIISGEIKSDALTKAEDDLMEEYLDEELSPAELELFKENFLISEERTDRLKQIYLIKSYTKKNAFENNFESEKAETDGFFRKITAFFALNQRPSTAILGTLILVLSGILLWQTIFQTSPERTASLQNKINALNEQDLSDLENYRNLTNLNLSAGTLRDSSGTNNLSTENLTENVLIRLGVPPDLADENAFNAKVAINREEVLTIEEIRAYGNQSGKEFRLLLPKPFLKKGEYGIEISAENPKLLPVKYTFIVK